jgi:hypothetical protein
LPRQRGISVGSQRPFHDILLAGFVHVDRAGDDLHEEPRDADDVRD